MNPSEIYKLYITKKCAISIDSRSTQIKGSIFFAIQGTEFNGNDFAEDAIKKGAMLAIVDDVKKKNKSFIIVEDVLKTLQSIACIHREKHNIPIIAITGSNGKTTTKDILSKIIASKYKTLSTKGNFNNHLGLPLTILSLKKDHDIAVIEMGANHVGEIKKLCEIAKPTHGIITNIGSAHIGEFGGVQNIIAAKNELFDYLKSEEKWIIYNESDAIIKKLVNNYPKSYTYNSPLLPINKNNNSIESCEYKCDPFISINYNNILTIKTKILGKYNINNIIASIKIATLFNISNQQIKKSLENIELKNNRSEFINTNKNNILLDAYNANPTSMSIGILNFIEIAEFLKYKNTLFILGDMLELGHKEIEYHQEIINLLEKNNVKECILVGERFSQTKCRSNYQKVISIKKCIVLLSKSDIKKKSIFIKGSRELTLEKTIQFL